ncbi:MAG: hypothetical protein IJQ81_15575 [Oscillibacter sp.]|nr:hypothetical protein [Oscillibacter sp.]
MASAKQKKEGLMYRGHPLRRSGNLIYYGSMADPYIVMMQVMETTRLDPKKVDAENPDADQSLNVATRVSIQLQSTQMDVKSRDRVIKKGEKDNLYTAMDFAYVWLDRALKGK